MIDITDFAGRHNMISRLKVGSKVLYSTKKHHMRVKVISINTGKILAIPLPNLDENAKEIL